MKKVRLLASAVLLISLLTSNVFAAGFTPSVESQDAPAVDKVVVTDKDGNDVVVGDEDIIVTPVSKADDAATEEISEALNAAMDDIQKADSLGDLASENGSIKDDLQNALAGTDYTVDDLAVSDLFDVSVVGETGDLIKDENTSVTLTFQVAVQSDEVLIVLHNYETGKWEVVDPSLVKINDNGTVSVTLNSLSPIAFVTAVDQTDPKPEPDPKPDTKPDSNKPAGGDGKPVTSPQTGETVNLYVVMAAVMLLAAAFCCMTRAKRAAR